MIFRFEYGIKSAYFSEQWDVFRYSGHTTCKWQNKNAYFDQINCEKLFKYGDIIDKQVGYQIITIKLLTL